MGAGLQILMDKRLDQASIKVMDFNGHISIGVKLWMS